MGIKQVLLSLLPKHKPIGMPLPACIGCKAAQNKIDQGHHLATHCRICGKVYVKPHHA